MKCSISLLALIGFISITAAKTNNLLCYYGSWGTYRNGVGRVTIEDIDPNLCTHIIYSFVGLNRDGSINVLDSWNDITNGGFNRFIGLKKKNPNVKLMIAIGGWNEGSEIYSSVVNSPSLRTRFVNSIVSFTLRYNFDGFDIDWEYPAERGGSSSDRSAYVQLLRELRPQFDKHGLLLTAAVGAPDRFHSSSYDVPSLSEYLDFINIMTYDFHGSYDGVTGQCSPLYASSQDHNKQLNVHAAIQSWIRAGAAPHKIILGIALYGRSYTLSNPSNNGVGAPVSIGGNSGPYSLEPGMLTYLEICEKQKNGGWTTVWDDQQKNPYTYNGNQWVGYDNAKSVVLKAQYAVENKLGGVMVWSVESDDSRNICGDGQYPLLKAIGTVIDVKEGSTGVPSVSTLSTSTTTTSSTTPTVPPTTSTTPTKPKPTTTTSTTEEPSVNTSSGVSCEKAGYIRDPDDCAVFYMCVQQGNGSFDPARFTCPAGLHFDLKFSMCNEPKAVQCSSK